MFRRVSRCSPTRLTLLNDCWLRGAWLSHWSKRPLRPTSQWLWPLRRTLPPALLRACSPLAQFLSSCSTHLNTHLRTNPNP